MKFIRLVPGENGWLKVRSRKGGKDFGIGNANCEKRKEKNNYKLRITDYELRKAKCEKREEKQLRRSWKL